ACGVEVGHRRRAARAIALGDLVQPDALLARTVEVVVAGEARLHACLDERVRKRIDVTQVGYRQRTVATVQRVAAARVAFAAAEVRQHRGPVPARRALRGPTVVVGGHAAHVAHGVERTRSAEHLAARPPQRAAAQLRLRRGVVVPVHALLPDQLRQPCRHVDEGVPVARAGFEQQHAHAGVFGQAIGEYAAGGAGADDDVVVFRARRVMGFGHRDNLGSRARAYARRGGARTGLWDTVCAPHGAETG